MKKRKLGTTDLYVTPVAFGVLTMGGSQMDLPLQEGAELIRYAIDQGINFFDTAQYYAVSYTHLDVYKRQAYHPVKACQLGVICIMTNYLFHIFFDEQVVFHLLLRRGRQLSHCDEKRTCAILSRCV